MISNPYVRPSACRLVRSFGFCPLIACFIFLHISKHFFSFIPFSLKRRNEELRGGSSLNFNEVGGMNKADIKILF